MLHTATSAHIMPCTPSLCLLPRSGGDSDGSLANPSLAANVQSTDGNLDVEDD